MTDNRQNLALALRQRAANAERPVSHLSTGSTTVLSTSTSPLAAPVTKAETAPARTGLPSIDLPSVPRASRPSVDSIPAPAVKVAEQSKPISLPTVAVAPVAVSKPAKPKAIKRRNRSRVLTEVDLVILNYLSIVRIAKVEHIADLIKDFKNPDVRTGEIKSPSPRTVELRMMRLQNFMGKANGYVDCNRQIAGHRVWFLTPKGEHVIKTGKRSVIPSNTYWNHYLALAAVAARDIRNGFALIGDDDINRAVRAHREIEKQEYVPLSVLKDNPEYKTPEVGKLVPHYFSIPLGNGKAHRPDLIILKEGMEPVAIEMELHYKSPKEVQANLSGHIQACREGRIGRVVYFGPAHIVKFLEGQLAKVVTDPSTVADILSFTRINLENMHADIPKIGGF